MEPLILGGVLDIGKKLIDRLIPDKEAAAKAQLELIVAERNGELEDLKVRLSAIIAEAQSNDPWTSRARPSFLYVMYILILTAVPMGILYAFKPDVAHAVTEGVKLWLEAIPSELYALFGAGYLGYSHYRSKEKQQVKGSR